MAKPTGESGLSIESTMVIFSIKFVSPAHQSSPLVQSSDCGLPLIWFYFTIYTTFSIHISNKSIIVC